MKVKFKNELYQLVITDHAQDRMRARNVSVKDVVYLLSKGKILTKDRNGHFWVYKNLAGRSDNFVCLSVSIESPFLVVITTLINWRPL